MALCRAAVAQRHTEDRKRFAGQIAVVTGAGSGVGRATCVRLAQEGAAVACLDVDHAAAEKTVAAVRAAGGQARAYQVPIVVSHPDSPVAKALTGIAQNIAAKVSVAALGSKNDLPINIVE